MSSKRWWPPRPRGARGGSGARERVTSLQVTISKSRPGCPERLTPLARGLGACPEPVGRRDVPPPPEAKDRPCGRVVGNKAFASLRKFLGPSRPSLRRGISVALALAG